MVKKNKNKMKMTITIKKLKTTKQPAFVALSSSVFALVGFFQFSQIKKGLFAFFALNRMWFYLS